LVYEALLANTLVCQLNGHVVLNVYGTIKKEERVLCEGDISARTRLNSRRYPLKSTRQYRRIMRWIITNQDRI